jgi:hypothetical protein
MSATGSAALPRTGASPARRAAVALALGAAALVLPGCDFICVYLPGLAIFLDDDDSAKEGLRAAPLPKVDPDAVSFVAPADLKLPNRCERTLPVELVPPFRVEAVVGLCDPAFYPDPSATFGMSVTEQGGAGRNLAIACSRDGGIRVVSGLGSDADVLFADSTRIDLALAHDGTDLVAEARDHETSGAWTEVGRVALTDLAGPMLAKVEGRNFLPGQMIGFYAFRVRANAPLGAGATPAHQAVRAMADAADALFDANDALEADVPDLDGAADAIELATLRLTEAGGMIVTKGKVDRATRKARKAAKRAAKAAKRTGKSATLLRETGAAAIPAATKQIRRAFGDTITAGDAILPDDLRAAIGGYTLKNILGR